jgi:hypothetical protein
MYNCKHQLQKSAFNGGAARLVAVINTNVL